MILHYTCDRDFRNIRAEPDLETWGRWFAGMDRSVEQTYLGEHRISTVFLGIDHGHGMHDYPVLFETLVFVGGKATDDMWRCCNVDEARAIHAARVAACKSINGLIARMIDG